MVRIKKTVVKGTSGGYERVLGDFAMGQLVSKVHSTVVSSGNELEDIILKKVNNTGDLDKFLKKGTIPAGVRIASKEQIKDCKTLHTPGEEADFLIFKNRNATPECRIVELKDGYDFDTKKAKGETKNLRKFARLNAKLLPCKPSVHVCSFNKNDRKTIVTGFKNKISILEAMTGREFCDWLEIDYDKIVQSRRHDQKHNKRYFLIEISKILLNDFLRWVFFWKKRDD